MKAQNIIFLPEAEENFRFRYNGVYDKNPLSD
jgi:hypothetical protein